MTDGVEPITDLIKAFNTVPREPVFQAAVVIGIPIEIVRGWAAAVTQLRRVFWVRNQPGPFLGSCAGFPEGCALSVAEMGLCNLIVHAFMEHRVPDCQVTTYVDNISITSQSPMYVLDSLHMLTEFCRYLGVLVDPKKTFAWSINAHDRKCLRSQGATVEGAKRDFGAHMQLNAKQTNSTVVGKLRDLEQLWPRLAQSKAPLSQKQRILTTVAWPRAFYSASTVHLSEQHITTLRTGAMKSMMLDKQGANPLVQLSLTGNQMQDPGFYLLWDSIAQARRHASPEVLAIMLDITAWVPNSLKKPGPAGVLAARLANIGWQYHSGASFLDHEHNVVDIMRAPVQEVKQRVKRAWCHAVGQQMSHRKDFEGLHMVDTHVSNRDFPDVTIEEAGLLRVLKNGTAITNNLLYASGQAETNCCRFCGQLDSMIHRHWECESTAHLRDMLNAEVIEAINQQPLCTRARGWFVEASSVTAFKHSLQDIPCSIHDHEFPPFVTPGIS